MNVGFFMLFSIFGDEYMFSPLGVLWYTKKNKSVYLKTSNKQVECNSSVCQVGKH